MNPTNQQLLGEISCRPTAENIKLFSLLNDSLSVTLIIQSRMKDLYIHYDLEKMWKEKVVACLLSRYLLDKLRKNTKNLSQASRSAGRDLTAGPHKDETEVLTTEP
jgi:hypothetical protein